MSYIIMAVGEDGMEFRGMDAEYCTEAEAYSHLSEASERFPEARLHVELLKDKDYYMEQRRLSENEYECYFDCDGEVLY